jgi:hypothetical protein
MISKHPSNFNQRHALRDVHILIFSTTEHSYRYCENYSHTHSLKDKQYIFKICIILEEFSMGYFISSQFNIR